MIEKENIKDGVKSIARFSDCEKYRYTLTRTWDSSKGKIVFIGLNPSTADEMKNDPTVTRMINFAKSWGYGTISVCNIFAYRATFPEDLKKQQDPVGPETDKWLKSEINSADKVVAAWGNHGKFNNRSSEIRKIISNNEIYSFGNTNLLEPKHVLYLKSSSQIIKI